MTTPRTLFDKIIARQAFTVTGVSGSGSGPRGTSYSGRPRSSANVLAAIQGGGPGSAEPGGSPGRTVSAPLCW